MLTRLAGDESFAAELKARNDRAAAEAASRPRTEAPAPRLASPAPAAATRSDEDESGGDWDDGAPEWPDENTEAAMVAELDGGIDTPAPGASRKRARNLTIDDGQALPDLDGVIAAIPAAVRDTLEELFRAQFTLVRRIPPGVFKQPPADDAN